MLHRLYNYFKMPESVTVHCFSMQLTNSIHQPCLPHMSASGVNSTSILFPHSWTLSPSPFQDAMTTQCCPVPRVAGIQQNTISFLCYFVLLLLYFHLGKTWEYRPPAETQQEPPYLCSGPQSRLPAFTSFPGGKWSITCTFLM